MDYYILVQEAMIFMLLHVLNLIEQTENCAERDNWPIIQEIAYYKSNLSGLNQSIMSMAMFCHHTFTIPMFYINIIMQ